MGTATLSIINLNKSNLPFFFEGGGGDFIFSGLEFYGTFIFNPVRRKSA